MRVRNAREGKQGGENKKAQERIALDDEKVKKTNGRGKVMRMKRGEERVGQNKGKGTLGTSGPRREHHHDVRT